MKGKRNTIWQIQIKFNQYVGQYLDTIKTWLVYLLDAYSLKNSKESKCNKFDWRNEIRGVNINGNAL